MFGLFIKRPLISPEIADWMFDCYDWLIRNCGGFDDFRDTPLVQPTQEFFDLSGELDSESELAEELFSQVKLYAGLDDWPCRLVAQEEDPDPRLGPTLLVKNTDQSPAGTFSTNRKEIIITYNPAGARDPVLLIATFAHELAHYLISTFPDPTPGGEDKDEYATDVASVFLGFGIFAVNSCFHFSQSTDWDSQGWETSRLGYFDEPEMVYALAIFASLLEIPHTKVFAHLKHSLRSLFKNAHKEITDRKDDLQALRTL